jgi:hypothetical protein
MVGGEIKDTKQTRDITVGLRTWTLAKSRGRSSAWRETNVVNLLSLIIRAASGALLDNRRFDHTAIYITQDIDLKRRTFHWGSLLRIDTLFEIYMPIKPQCETPLSRVGQFSSIFQESADCNGTCSIGISKLWYATMAPLQRTGIWHFVLMHYVIYDRCSPSSNGCRRTRYPAPTDESARTPGTGSRRSISSFCSEGNAAELDMHGHDCRGILSQ